MNDFEFQTSLLVLLERIAVAMERQATAVETSVARRASNGGGATPEMSDAELDGDPRGNPKVRKDPKAWKGPSFAGKELSQCSPEFLEVYANALEFKSQREHEEAADLAGEEKAKKLKWSSFSRLDAKRARGWARRIRAGWTPPAAPAPGQESWRKPAAAAPAATPAHPEDRGYPASFDDPIPETPPAPAPKTDDLEGWDE